MDTGWQLDKNYITFIQITVCDHIGTLLFVEELFSLVTLQI